MTKLKSTHHTYYKIQKYPIHVEEVDVTNKKQITGKKNNYGQPHPLGNIPKNGGWGMKLSMIMGYGRNFQKKSKFKGQEEPKLL